MSPRSAVQEYGVGQKLYAQNMPPVFSPVSFEHLEESHHIKHNVLKEKKNPTPKVKSNNIESEGYRLKLNPCHKSAFHLKAE